MIAITLTGNTPVVVTEPLPSILLDIASGNITGDESGWGGANIVGVFSIENLGISGQELNGVTLPTSGLFVQQIVIGDTDCSGTINSDDYNSIAAFNPEENPGATSDQGLWPPQPNLSYLAFVGWFKVEGVKGILENVKNRPTTAGVQNAIDFLNR